MQPFPSGGSVTAVSTGWGVAPVWSRDGRELFYRDQFQLFTGFSLAAVLADDQARYGLEHLGGSYDGPRRQLSRRDGPLTRGSRDTDKVLGWILKLRQVAKRPCGRDGDIRGERDPEYGIGRDRLSTA